MDPLPVFIPGLMIGSVGTLLGQAHGRRRTTRMRIAMRAGHAGHGNARLRRARPRDWEN